VEDLRPILLSCDLESRLQVHVSFQIPSKLFKPRSYYHHRLIYHTSQTLPFLHKAQRLHKQPVPEQHVEVRVSYPTWQKKNPNRKQNLTALQVEFTTSVTNQSPCLSISQNLVYYLLSSLTRYAARILTT
jgi:hypothetical protein